MLAQKYRRSRKKATILRTKLHSDMGAKSGSFYGTHFDIFNNKKDLKQNLEIMGNLIEDKDNSIAIKETPTMIIHHKKQAGRVVKPKCKENESPNVECA